MNKRILTALIFLLSSTIASAQTLFTYGNESVTVPEFLKAYHKNNTATKSAAAMQTYLDLYIASRLKIKEAKARGLDTLPQLNADLAELRQQILPGFLTDEESIKALVKEAFDRSQKDIHAAHLFIAVQGNDTTEAAHKLQEVYKLLKNGRSFSEVARLYSDDLSVKDNGGDMGYITVFTLPYALENVVYATAAGQVSNLYRSKIGYHLFKNMGERKAVGRMRAAQILLAFPPDADASVKASVKKQADSIYASLLKGDDFGKLAATLSADLISAASQGQIPEFGVGQFDPQFENIAFGLSKDGAFSKPFQSAHGWHIVKRISIEPVPADFSSAQVQDELPEKVKTSDRIQTANEIALKKVMAQYNALPFSTTELSAYSDSVFNNKAVSAATRLKPQTTLFTIGKQAATVDNWMQFAQMNRYKTDGTGLKTYTQLWDEFVTATALAYYQDHLEQYNPAFKTQMDEFKEGNLFFEIMQQEIWNPAQNDTTALIHYFNQHRTKYNWQESAEAVVFYVNDIPMAQLFYKELSKTPAQWRRVVDRFSEQVATDSGRFELAQLPGYAKGMKAGAVTAITPNKEDNTASFAYILKMYPAAQPRSFAQTKGLVINDYQAELEKRWLATLYKKYPVTIDQKVWAGLLAQQ